MSPPSSMILGGTSKLSIIKACSSSSDGDVNVNVNVATRSNNTAITSNDKTFEVDGANAARAFLQHEGGSAWDEHRIQLVWDAIALHTSNQIHPHKQREVAYTAAGTAAELFGPTLANSTLVCSIAFTSFTRHIK